MEAIAIVARRGGFRRFVCGREQRPALLVAGARIFPGKKPWAGRGKGLVRHCLCAGEPDRKMESRRESASATRIRRERHLQQRPDLRRRKRPRSALRRRVSPGVVEREVENDTPLSLPTPIANCCGAIVGDILYIAGGIEKPDAKETSNRAWQIDLRSKSPQWTEIATWPGSRRMLAVAAGFRRSFWLIGGVDLTGQTATVPHKRHYLTGRLSLRSSIGWKRIADLPHSVVAAPSPAPSDKRKYLLAWWRRRLPSRNGQTNIEDLERIATIQCNDE